MQPKPNQTPSQYHQFQLYFSRLTLPKKQSHKGQNGKVLIVGGSELFHSASKWSLDVASKLVDMVFYSSVPINNTLVAKAHELSAKESFWNGIVVSADQLDFYAKEADAILIGPGMDRSTQTSEKVEKLLLEYSFKKWVIDAGALQMVSPHLIPSNCILTPHQREFELLVQHGFELESAVKRGVVVIIKGEFDEIHLLNHNHKPTVLRVDGGNSGMTKGGTGDVLAGLVVGLFATQSIEVASVVASVTNKMAGDDLYSQVGPYFNASDLANSVPHALWRLAQFFHDSNQDLS
jgi:hydroxyethylthiazole kinase-like uncharacterized protein yjeF